MDTISELEYYCDIDHPVGAMLLTGEWGSGKTYLINHTFQERSRNEFIIIRISLFGISSVEELHNEVKKSWIIARGGIGRKVLELGKYSNIFSTINDHNPFETPKSVINGVLSINPLDFIEVENIIHEKKVILVFDDLERSCLSMPDRLGVINEYCENQGFNVIIIADESKLSAISEYINFKEKIVQKTVYYTPDYKEVVQNLISSIKNGTYRSFLLHNKKNIIGLFAGKDPEGNSLNSYTFNIPSFMKRPYKDSGLDEEERRKQLQKSRPHNIRSLKSAIQEFERIFVELHKKGVDNPQNWFLSFISFTMTERAGLLFKSEQYDYIFSDIDLEMLYPGYYNPNYMPTPLKEWVLYGVWNKDALDEYINRYIQKKRELDPWEYVITGYIDELDEEVAIKGLLQVLPYAYNGELSLNGYVFFIMNSYLARNYQLPIDEINWDKVCLGIRTRIERNIQNGETHEPLQQAISNLENYSPEEKGAYEIIREARENSIAMFSVNKNQYIEEMLKNGIDSFKKISGLSYNCFDQEMADATIEAFKNSTNEDMKRFPSYFKGIWRNFRNSHNINPKGILVTEESLKYLRNKLRILELEYTELVFKSRFTQNFIGVINELIEQESPNSVSN